jgi:hypothetical protein
MALTLKVSTDQAGLERKLEEKILKRAPRAAAAGINRAAQGAFTLSVREIQKDIGATAQKSIRRNLSLSKASAAKPEARLTALSSKKERVPIYEIAPKPRSVTRRRPPGGVTYGPQSKLIPGSFIARMQSGHIGVFQRIRDKRLPVRELFGPSVALVFSRRKIRSKIQEFLKEKVPQEIARALKFAG